MRSRSVRRISSSRAHAGLAARGQRPAPRAADEHAVGAERERADDVGAAPHAAVEQHLHVAAGQRAATAGSACSEAGTPSSWRPPWLETITPSTPQSAARTGVVGVQHALQRDRPRPARAQALELRPSRGAGRTAAAASRRSGAASPRSCRAPRSGSGAARSQRPKRRGCASASRTFAAVGRGGKPKPLRRSRSRSPRRGRVGGQDQHLAARAAAAWSTSRSVSARSRSA